MASLRYTDIQKGVYFLLDGSVYETISSTFSKKSRQQGSNQVRIKNISTGSVVTKTLRASHTLETVNFEKKPYVFVYIRGDRAVVHPEGSPSDRIEISIAGINGTSFIPPETVVTALEIDGVPLTFLLPLTVDVLVKEAPPTVRGNTTQGGNKKVVLETKASITTPLFIEAGDKIRIHTTTGEYVERVLKG